MISTQLRVKLLHTTTIAFQMNQFLRGQVPYMQQADVCLDVYGISSGGPQMREFEEREGAELFSVEMAREVTPLADVKALAKIVKTLRKVRPTIVHGHSPKGGLLGMISAWLTRTPIRIYTVHGLWYVSGVGWRRHVIKLTEKISCTLAHQVLSVSSSVQEQAVADGLCSAEKIKTLAAGSSNGIDAKERFNLECLPHDLGTRTRHELGIPEDATVLGFVGRIFQVKGVVEIERAWQSVRERHSDAYLLLVGPFDPQKPIPSDSKERLQNDPRVVFTGAVKDARPYYASMDVFTLPSYQEGFGAVLIEAAAMNLPTISTRALGCVDAVEDGVTGTLIPIGDVDALIASIERYFDDPYLRQRHGNAGRARTLRLFQREIVWDALYEEYVRLLKERGYYNNEETASDERLSQRASDERALMNTTR